MAFVEFCPGLKDGIPLGLIGLTQAAGRQSEGAVDNSSTKVGEMIAHPDKKYSAVAGTSTQFIVLKDSTFGVRVPPGPLKLPDMGPNDRSGRPSLNRNSSFSQS